MIRLITTLLFAGSLSVAHAAPLTFGHAVNKDNITPVATIIANPAKYVDTAITIEGEIQAVCQMRGCWMTLAAKSGDPTFRIKVRDGDMEFPVSAKGKTAYATGTVNAHTLNMTATLDYMEEQAENRGETFDPSNVTEPLTFYQFVPTAVEIAE